MIARILTLFLYLPISFLGLLHGQSDVLLVSPASVSKEVVVNSLAADFEDISTLRVTNSSSQMLQLRWSKKIESQPSGWQTFLYAKKPGYGPYASGQYAQSDEQANFRLKAGETIEFYLILKPNNKSGKGRIELSFSSVTQPNLSLGSSVYDFNVVNREATQRTNAVTPSRRGTTRVYPNPAIDNFFVELPRGVGAGKVEVFNTLGRKLKTYSYPDPEKGYPINDLPEGIYLISIYDDRGEKIKTLRLLHRRFGA